MADFDTGGARRDQDDLNYEMLRAAIAEDAVVRIARDGLALLVSTADFDIIEVERDTRDLASHLKVARPDLAEDEDFIAQYLARTIILAAFEIDKRFRTLAGPRSGLAT